jgi:hypothetical protein
MDTITPKTFYSNNFYEFLLANDLYETRSTFAKSIIQLISANSDQAEQMQFKLLRPESPLFQISQNRQSVSENSNIKMKPDWILTLEEINVCPIELELCISSKSQINQLLAYFEQTYRMTTEQFQNSSLLALRYLQFLRIICVSFVIDSHIKKTLVLHSAQNCPVIFIEIKNHWQLLPQESLTYQAFQSLEQIGDNAERAQEIIEKIRGSELAGPKKFYLLTLLYIFGGENVKTIIKGNQGAYEILTDIKKAIQEVNYEWVKQLSSEQLKGLELEQLKGLEPDKMIQAIELMDEESRKKIVERLLKK